jgi:2-C-methyl-D-erythritol 2,4-cyclodiphosphate synthase
MRVGQGFDVHRFGPGDYVMLGGIKVPHTHGVIAHSDGDVLLHALCDALLGAAGLGDIGQHFPDTDSSYAGADSRELLKSVVAKVQAAGWDIVNCDTCVIAQRPKLSLHREDIRRSIAKLLGLAPDAVNVKATTTENLGYTGRNEGLAAQAVALLQRASGA